MFKVLYTLLFLLLKVGLKVPIKPKLSTYRILFVRLSYRVGILFGQLFQCQLMVVNQF